MEKYSNIMAMGEDPSDSVGDDAQYPMIDAELLAPPEELEEICMNRDEQTMPAYADQQSLPNEYQSDVIETDSAVQADQWEKLEAQGAEVATDTAPESVAPPEDDAQAAVSEEVVVASEAPASVAEVSAPYTQIVEAQESQVAAQAASVARPSYSREETLASYKTLALIAAGVYIFFRG